MCKHTPQSPLTNTRSYCVMCKSEIVAGAKLCPICKSHQSSCIRSIYNCATMGGIVMVVIALLTYVTSTLPEIRKMFFWQDVIEITAFDSSRHIIIHNSGDGKIFVSHLSLRSKELGHASTLTINKTVDSKSFLIHDLTTPTKDSNKWGTGRPIREDLWQNILKKKRLTENECLHWIYFCANDHNYQQLKTFITDVNTSFREVSVDGTLYFRSGRDGHLISQDIKLFAVPFFKETKACGAPDSWFR